MVYRWNYMWRVEVQHETHLVEPSTTCVDKKYTVCIEHKACKCTWRGEIARRGEWRGGHMIKA